MWKKFEELTGFKPNRTTLWRTLTDPINIGKVYAYRHKIVMDSQGRKRRVSVPENEWVLVYEDLSLRIFSDEEYYALKHRFQLNKENSPRRTKYNYPPLKGKVKCLPCSLKMSSLTTNFGTAYYRCPSCRNHTNAWNVWEKIRSHLTSLILAPERLAAFQERGVTGARTGHERRWWRCLRPRGSEYWPSNR